MKCRPNLPLLFLLLFQIQTAYPVDSLESVQETARKWIDLRLESSELESDWAWQKGLMESMRDTLLYRIEQSEQEKTLIIAQNVSRNAEAEQARERIAELEKELATLELHNEALIGKLQSLRDFLPPRLSDSLDLAYTSIADPDLSTGEKLQLLVTILNRCMQFNNRITYSEEIFNTDTGTQKHVVQVLYWGLSHAYALNRETSETYLGKPTERGWHWTPIAGMSPEIIRLIDVFKEAIDPELVSVPVQVYRIGGDK